MINNRSEGEDDAQPGTGNEASAAREAGLDYVHIPMTSASISLDDIQLFDRVIAASDGPVIAHGRSGRCAFYRARRMA